MAAVHSRILGDGPRRLVLLHAFPLSSAMWDGLRPPSGHHLVLPDFPGFGTSPATSSPLSFTDLSQALQDHLTALPKAEKTLLGGISMGGYWALEYARLHQAHLEGLLLISTRAGVDKPEGRQNRLKMAERAENEGMEGLVEALLPGLLGKSTFEKKPLVVEKLRQWVKLAPPQAVALAQRTMAGRRDQTDLLPSIALRTLVLAGQEDALIPPTEAQSMAAAIPGAGLRVLEGVGHLIPLETPGSFQAILNEFESL
ncbi:MAG TPA: alpha/beta hydrolase [bacterium]|nr:alpha/beta hydrolase [bacterium]